MSSVLDKSTVEKRIDTDAQAARDESRLSMIAYWLVKYGSFFGQDKAAFNKKFAEMVRSLETDDAKSVAEAWKSDGKVGGSNQFAEVAPKILEWARTVSAKRDR